MNSPKTSLIIMKMKILMKFRFFRVTNEAHQYFVENHRFFQLPCVDHLYFKEDPHDFANSKFLFIYMNLTFLRIKKVSRS